jgi:NAD(P)-dependent dehydrogenase (short-subunit alcohol dehydrogenase family)
MVNINLNGLFFCSQAVGKEMIKRGGGKIINISSLSGLAAQPNSIHYVATKHGVIGITKSLAIDWAKYNIKVNCICPGITETPMAKKQIDKDSKMMAERIKRIPLGRIAQPEDHAKAAVFFASSESDACIK